MKEAKLINQHFLEKKLKEYKEPIKDNSQIFLKWHNDNRKEEAVQSDFLNDIFGKILGYEIETDKEYNLDKEYKTQKDGTKVDGVLGFFKKESKNGEGGRAAMPIWAYFMRKAAADPACGIDTKMTFNRPEDINTDIQIDYTNGNVPIMSGESENGGGVVETGYDAANSEVIGAESDTSLLGVRPKSTPPAGDQTPAKPSDNKTDTKSPANLPPKPPVPAPKKTGGN